MSTTRERITPRRTQQERTAATRRTLLAATVDALAEDGYQGATTTEICRRAGVSRGALLHHYPTRSELLVAAAETMANGHIAEFRAAMGAIADEGLRIEAAIDRLWADFSSPHHVAWLELSVGCRHEPAVVVAVAALHATLRARVYDAWAATFPEAQDRMGPVVPDLAIAIMEGLALGRMNGAPPETAGGVLTALKAIALAGLSDQFPEAQMETR